jgi:hypothetical protein
MTYHDDRQADNQEHVGAAFEFFEFSVAERLLFRKMPPDSIHERFDILDIGLFLATYPVTENRIPFRAVDRGHNVLLKSMAQLPFIDGRRIMCVEIIPDRLLIDG